jgi:hypothetical protein
MAASLALNAVLNSQRLTAPASFTPFITLS